MNNQQNNRQLSFLEDNRDRLLRSNRRLYIMSVVRCHIAVENLRCKESDSTEDNSKRAKSLITLLDRPEFRDLPQRLRDAASLVKILRAI